MSESDAPHRQAPEGKVNKCHYHCTAIMRVMRMGFLRRMWDTGHTLRWKVGLNSDHHGCPERLRRLWHSFADFMIEGNDNG